MKKRIAVILICCLFLFCAASCDGGKTEASNDSMTAETTGKATEEIGEPFDPNNEYANDNNAYYSDAWK